LNPALKSLEASRAKRQKTRSKLKIVDCGACGSALQGNARPFSISTILFLPSVGGRLCTNYKQKVPRISGLSYVQKREVDYFFFFEAFFLEAFLAAFLGADFFLEAFFAVAMF